MAQRMLIDTTHPEEIRVAVVSGNRLDDLDYETSTKKQLKGNIYLAKVVRVEPSLQACFVDYGGNRHGFLAFSEIHPDYYRIPIADREALLAEQAAAAAEEDYDSDGPDHGEQAEAQSQPDSDAQNAGSLDEAGAAPPLAEPEFGGEEPQPGIPAGPVEHKTGLLADQLEARAAETVEPEGAEPDHAALDIPPVESSAPAEAAAAEAAPGVAGETPAAPQRPVETVGGDAVDEVRRRRPRQTRNYKIQEVIKRRQIMLIQVVKEERGNKGAALTTYLSLAGRYCVLMPNTTRGGGVSRKITNATDRRRLKSLLDDLNLPPGMGVIVRTAGSERSKPEVKRDCDYLLKLWDEIREATLKSTAPCLIYEEASLIKRAIRDLYARDIDEILVEGDEGYRAAKDFMKMLMPSHAKRVQQYKDPIPLFHRFQIESQIDAMHTPVVQLRSGGYIVINPTEALVAIDVNSGRATRERFIEETALRTNLEAAEEVARQLRLRDLGGLVVVDFIDMEDHRNNHAVERRIKEALRFDRARIQVGRISPFGLLEMSRQRLRPSIHETSTTPCAHCGGTGHMRSTESASLHVLRALEEEGIRRRSREVVVHVATQVALYILNQKRAMLTDIEQRYGFSVTVMDDPTLIPPNYRLERVRAAGPEAAAPVRAESVVLPPYDETAEAVAAEEPAAEAEAPMGERFDPAELEREHAGDHREHRAPRGDHRGPRGDHRGPHEPQGEGGRDGRGGRRRRGRGRGRGRQGEDRGPLPVQAGGDAPGYAPDVEHGQDGQDRGGAPAESFAAETDLGADRAPQPGPGNGDRGPGDGPQGDQQGDGEHRRRRRRGRRGGRRRRGERDGRGPGPQGMDADMNMEGDRDAGSRDDGPRNDGPQSWQNEPAPQRHEPEAKPPQQEAEQTWSPRPDLHAAQSAPEPRREPPQTAAEANHPSPKPRTPNASTPANVTVVDEGTPKPEKRGGWWRRMTSGES